MTTGQVLRETRLSYVYAFRTEKLQVASIHIAMETICLRYQGNSEGYRMMVYN